MTPNQFIGTWRLVSFEIRDANGQAIYPYRSGKIGRVMHTIPSFTDRIGIVIDSISISFF
ncbi:MAG: hypothetical protein GDA56_07190 [Hormoscilla sp. GM7CHS1pb]|nr:hypothetical protein [Hormoscilla sp. GM7CHS1pb]